MKYSVLRNVRVSTKDGVKALRAGDVVDSSFLMADASVFVDAKYIKKIEKKKTKKKVQKKAEKLEAEELAVSDEVVV